MKLTESSMVISGSEVYNNTMRTIVHIKRMLTFLVYQSVHHYNVGIQAKYTVGVHLKCEYRKHAQNKISIMLYRITAQCMQPRIATEVSYISLCNTYSCSYSNVSIFI